LPSSEFSEFTFGFAFTQEVTSLCWSALGGAPTMPSLFDEGHGKGFDAAVGLWGWTLFAQFKKGWRATRSSALQWSTYNSEYYRFEIYPNSRSTQHEDLLALERAAPLHWVAYVAPVFHSNARLNSLFMNQHVLDNVRMIAPRAIGHLDDDLHYVTYRTRTDAPLVHSDPKTINAISVRQFKNRLAQTDWSLEEEDLQSGEVPAGPVKLDDTYFNALFERMIQAVGDRATGRTAESLMSELDAMTPFGRARTAGRLLFGGELLALPAAGQDVG
jgi:hypothetical protein